MFVYARLGSQLASCVPSQLSGLERHHLRQSGHSRRQEKKQQAHQSPCTVQLSTGPVTSGGVSQNCVCSSSPPGAAKQHVSATAEVLWQLCGRLAGQLTDEPAAAVAARPSEALTAVRSFCGEATESMLARQVSVWYRRRRQRVDAVGCSGTGWLYRTLHVRGEAYHASAATDDRHPPMCESRHDHSRRMKARVPCFPEFSSFPRPCRSRPRRGRTKRAGLTIGFPRTPLVG